MHNSVSKKWIRNKFRVGKPTPQIPILFLGKRLPNLVREMRISHLTRTQLRFCRVKVTEKRKEGFSDPNSRLGTEESV